jgi:hypothetical protein
MELNPTLHQVGIQYDTKSATVDSFQYLSPLPQNSSGHGRLIYITMDELDQVDASDFSWTRLTILSSNFLAWTSVKDRIPIPSLTNFITTPGLSCPYFIIQVTRAFAGVNLYTQIVSVGSFLQISASNIS